MKYQTLLQIDDDQDDCELFAEALREVSEITYTAINNPIKALQKLKSGKIKPDLIILDFNMPGMNGLDLLEALRRFGRIKNSDYYAIHRHTRRLSKSSYRARRDGLYY